MRQNDKYFSVYSIKRNWDWFSFSKLGQTDQENRDKFPQNLNLAKVFFAKMSFFNLDLVLSSILGSVIKQNRKHIFHEKNISCWSVSNDHLLRKQNSSHFAKLTFKSAFATFRTCQSLAFYYSARCTNSGFVGSHGGRPRIVYTSSEVEYSNLLDNCTAVPLRFKR